MGVERGGKIALLDQNQLQIGTRNPLKRDSTMPRRLFPDNPDMLDSDRQWMRRISRFPHNSHSRQFGSHRAKRVHVRLFWVRFPIRAFFFLVCGTHGSPTRRDNETIRRRHNGQFSPTTVFPKRCFLVGPAPIPIKHDSKQTDLFGCTIQAN
jgi:hypothetical protein